MSQVKNTDYLYLSAYLRAKEAGLLTRERLERMAAAPDYAEAAKVLAECGYPELDKASDAEIEEAFAVRRAAVLDDIEKLCPEPALVDAFRLRFDYHNAKVLVKAEGAGTDGSGLLSRCGRVSGEVLAEAYDQDDWRAVPQALAAAIRGAKNTLARTANPQLADIELDKAYFGEFMALADSLSSDFCTRYGQLCIDTANLRSAVRCLRGGMDEGVLAAAVIDGGDIPAGPIARRVYSEGLEAVFTSRRLAEAAALGQKAVEGGPLTPFELACENAVTRFLGDAKYISIGPEAVVAYLAMLEGEIIAARTVLFGKRGGVSHETLRERLRDTYV